MKLAGSFLKLIRYPNLVYIFLTQYLLQYAVLVPVYGAYGIDSTLGYGRFFLLSLSTVLIAAAGYIINDYFDINIDQVNKPERIIIDRVISRRWAILWHTLFNVIGVAAGFFIGWKIGMPLLGITQLACSGLLWF
jgi:4-hydroxybenzoate polyprenyltransferase